MFRYRLLFSKTGPARYISHLDLLKAFERALRRAGLPLAFSQGFNPHPKMSFAAPSPVGIVGEEEYADIELTEQWSVEMIKNTLTAALPNGLDLKNVRQVDYHAPSAMALVNRATYKVKCALKQELSQTDLEKKLEEFLNETELFVEKKTKKGSTKTVNIRPGIYKLNGKIDHHNHLELGMELAIGSLANVRPEDVVSVLQEKEAIGFIPGEISICRTGLFVGGDAGTTSLWES